MKDRKAVDVLIYPKLNFQEREIRVLQVDPELSSDGLVQCLLYVATILHGHIALSYTWGPILPCQCVLINGTKFTVRENLFNFLHIARKKFHSMPLWIDAICIDQGATIERNHQVAFMGDIYKEANEVLVWLGQGDTDIEGTLDAFSNFGPKSWAQEKLVSEKRYDVKHAIPPGDWAIYRATDSAWPDREASWHNLHQLCQLPYWDRMWITQEYLLAQGRRYLYGNAECFRFQMERVFSHFLPLSSGTLQAMFSKLMTGILRSRARLLCSQSFEFDRNDEKQAFLFHQLQQHQNAKCSDFHDRVYALRALCPEAESFTVDYGTTRLEFLLNISVFCVKELAQKQDFQEASTESRTKTKTSIQDVRRLISILTNIARESYKTEALSLSSSKIFPPQAVSMAVNCEHRDLPSREWSSCGPVSATIDHDLGTPTQPCLWFYLDHVDSVKLFGFPMPSTPAAAAANDGRKRYSIVARVPIWKAWETPADRHTEYYGKAGLEGVWAYSGGLDQRSVVCFETTYAMSIILGLPEDPWVRKSCIPAMSESGGQTCAIEFFDCFAF